MGRRSGLTDLILDPDDESNSDCGRGCIKSSDVGP
jgi:hypothetical protein